jgi:tripartite-type tricarboxylate transporter receptor subunit TctC
MRSPTRRLLDCTVFAVTACLTGLCVAAQSGETYPVRAVRMIVPTAAGGAADNVARIFAQKLSESWGQTCLVDPRAGANGNIGAELLARSEPDGYTIMMGTIGVLAINKSLYKSMGYDQLRDFAPVGQVVSFALLLVTHPAQPFTNITELIAYAKANPGKINYGSPGIGGSPHMGMELFAKTAGIKIVHVAYKGAAAATTDVVGGQLQLMFSDPTAGLPHVRSGRLRALGVSGPARLPAAPEIPTIAEAGLPGFAVTSYLGVVAPARTPAATIARLNAELNRIAAQPDVVSRIDAMGAQIKTGTPAEFGTLIRNETARWAQVVVDAGLKAE